MTAAPGFVEVTFLAVGSCRAPARAVARGARGTATFPALVAVLRHATAGVLLFDTGYGAALVDSPSWLARAYRRALPFSLAPAARLGAQLERLRIAPEALAGVVVSHFHPDHVGGLRELPAVPVYAAGAELESLRRLRGPARVRQAFLPELLPDDLERRLRPFEERTEVRLLADLAPFATARDLFGDGSLLAVPLPGHALGQHGLLCRLAGGRTLFLVADAGWLAVNFTDLAPPLWPVRRLVGDAGDWRRTQRALHELHSRNPGLPLVPSHCTATQGAVLRAGLAAGPPADDGDAEVGEPSSTHGGSTP